MNPILRIGEFSMITGVSVKTLRFYAEQDLLHPAHIDPDTGYRYYKVEQCETLALIANLRAIDFSIAEVRSLLQCADDRQSAYQKAIENKRRSLVREQESLREKIAWAKLLSKQAVDDPQTVFRLVQTTTEPFHTVRRHVAHLGEPVTAIFELAEADVASRRQRAQAAPILIFHDPPTKTENLDLEVCIPVKSDGTAPQPAGAVAFAATYGGGYQQSDELYRRMRDHIEECGLRPAGGFREVYHRYGAQQDGYQTPSKNLAAAPIEYLTEVQLPIAIHE